MGRRAGAPDAAAPGLPFKEPMIDLDGLEKLEAKATGGPWDVIDDEKTHRIINPAGDAELGNWTVADNVWWLTNAALIVALRNNAKALIAGNREADKLRVELA